MKIQMNFALSLLDVVYLLSDVGNLDSVDIETPPCPSSCPQLANLVLLVVVIRLAAKQGGRRKIALQAAVPTVDVHLITPDPFFLNILFSPFPFLLLNNNPFPFYI